MEGRSTNEPDLAKMLMKIGAAGGFIKLMK
ncbi:hypothetical protein JTE90_023764, partial [Oedothorax gibbosus]